MRLAGLDPEYPSVWYLADASAPQQKADCGTAVETVLERVKAQSADVEEEWKTLMDFTDILKVHTAIEDGTLRSNPGGWPWNICDTDKHTNWAVPYFCSQMLIGITQYREEQEAAQKGRSKMN